MPKNQRHSLLTAGVALLEASNAAAHYAVTEQMFQSIRRNLEQAGEAPLKRFDLQNLNESLARECQNGHAGETALAKQLERADALSAIGCGRDHAACSQVRVAAERLLANAGEALLDSVRVEADRRPASVGELVPALLAELDGHVSSFIEGSGSGLQDLERRAARVRQLLGLQAELSDDFLERARSTLGTALYPHLLRAEESLARGALQGLVPSFHRRIVAGFELVAAASGGFQVKLDRIAASLRSRIEAAHVAEGTGSGGFEMTLPGITTDELLARLADALDVEPRKLPEAVAERLAEGLRKRVAARFKADAAQGLSLPQLLIKALDEEVLDELLGIIRKECGVQPVFGAVRDLQGGTSAAAKFLWEAATPTALPAPSAVPRLGVHVHRLNILVLPASEERDETRDAIVRAVEDLAGGEGIQVVHAPPGENAVALLRLVCGFPPGTIRWLDVLARAHVRAEEHGHHSDLVEAPGAERALDAGAPVGRLGWLVLLCGGSGVGTAQTIRRRLAVSGICHVVRAIDLDKSSAADIHLPLAKHLPAIIQSPKKYGSVGEYVAKKHPSLLDAEFLDDGGAGTIPFITELAVNANRDSLQQDLRGAVQELTRQGADAVKVVIVASTGGGTGSALARLLPELLHDRSFRDGVEFGLPGTIRSVVLSLIDPIGKVDLATPRDDAEAFQPLKIKSNSYKTWVDVAHLAQSGKIQYAFITGLTNGAGVSLAHPADAERHLGTQVATFISTFGTFHAQLINDWVFANQSAVEGRAS